MSRRTNFIAATISGLAILAGCAAPVDKPDESGFLSDYSKLEFKENGNISYFTDRVGEYESFIIDPISILYERDAENPMFTDEEIEEIKTYFIDELTEKLTDGENAYQVVNEPGPGVARLRIGITQIDATDGALNITIYTKITGAGLGGISAEGELVDSVSGEQLAAAIRWGNGSRVLRAGFTHAGDAKIAIGKWAKDLRKSLDEIHGR